LLKCLDLTFPSILISRGIALVESELVRLMQVQPFPLGFWGCPAVHALGLRMLWQLGIQMELALVIYAVLRAALLGFWELPLSYSQWHQVHLFLLGSQDLPLHSPFCYSESDLGLLWHSQCLLHLDS
jgi:hypothetical protein